MAAREGRAATEASLAKSPQRSKPGSRSRRYGRDATKLFVDNKNAVPLLARSHVDLITPDNYSYRKSFGAVSARDRLRDVLRKRLIYHTFFDP